MILGSDCRPCQAASGLADPKRYRKMGAPTCLVCHIAEARKSPGRTILWQGIDMSAASGLDGLLEPLSRCLDAASARRILDLKVDPPVQERIDTLAERANEGTLSDNERSEYEALINAADFISILKIKAQLHLASQIQ